MQTMFDAKANVIPPSTQLYIIHHSLARFLSLHSVLSHLRCILMRVFRQSLPAHVSFRPSHIHYAKTTKHST